MPVTILDAMQHTDIVAPNYWSDDLTAASLSDSEIADNTHYFVMSNQTIMTSGSIA